METLTTNKKFIKMSVILMALLSLLVLALFINQVKEGKYIGRSAATSSTISVSADGSVMAVPNISTISVTMEKDGATTKEAQDSLNTLVTKTLAYIRTQNIADKDVKSEYGGVTPKYGPTTEIVCVRYPCPQPNQKVIGYTATQSITIKIRNIDTANDVRTGLANLGITNISGPTFTIDDQTVLQDQARANAIAAARVKAKELARELGVELGGVVNFSENGGGGPIMYSAKALGAGDMASAPAPVLPTGENKITSSVTITYEIK